MPDQITAHIKLDDDQWQRLGKLAENHRLTTAQLVRNVLNGWLDGQVIGLVDDHGQWSNQQLGHRGFNPSQWATREDYLRSIETN